VSVEVDEAERAMSPRARANVGLGDRVVAAEDERDRARVDDLPHRLLDRAPRRLRSRRDDGRVAEVDDRELGERVDLRLEVRAGRAARGADRARREPRAGAIGDEVVERGADDRDVDAAKPRRILRVGHARIG
jgi:hypothetical protein